MNSTCSKCGKVVSEDKAFTEYGDNKYAINLTFNRVKDDDTLGEKLEFLCKACVLEIISKCNWS